MRRFMPVAVIALAACGVRLPAPPPPPPDTTYAWVTFDASGQRARGAAGLADRARGRALTIDDPVRIASISKLVVGLGVMRLVEQGKLDLDEDVSARLGWRLRNPAFPRTPITLRLLLSHRSSLTDDADYVIPLGRTLREALEAPAAYDARHAPGTYFRYSNLNFPLIASVMESATGERFDKLMRRLVMQPLGLEACFNWSPCSASAIARAVVLYGADGAVVRDDLGGKPPACPVVSVAPECDLGAYVLSSNGAIFSPQGGLRISARDLARVGQMLLGRGRLGGTRFLREASIDTLMRPVWTFDGSNGDTSDGFYCSYGLATQVLPIPQPGCRDDLFGNGRSAAGHAGDAYGVRSGLWVDARLGVGIAYFATNNGGDPAKGRSSYRAIEEWLAARIGAARR